MDPDTLTADEENEETAVAGKWARVFRFLWYLFATVLVLSLPTFSFLVPDPKYSFIAGYQSTQIPGQGDKLVPAKQVSDPDYVLERRLIQGRRTSPGSRRVLSGLLPAQRGRLPNRGSANRPAASVTSVEQKQETVESSDPKPGVQPPPVPVAQNLGPETVPNEMQALAQLEQGYQRLASNLARSRYAPRGGNPFQDALGDGSGTAGDSSDNSNNSGGDTSPPPTSDAGDNSGDSSSQPPSLDVVDTGPGASYRFLLVGALAGNPSSSLVSRGNMEADGSFVLENFYRFSLFPGGLHSLLVFDEYTTLLTGDFNRDGISDLLTVQLFLGVGTSIEAYIGTSTGFQLYGSSFFYYTSIHSIAVFDFDQDGRDELAVLFEGRKNLFVFRLSGNSWEYAREMVLPFQTDVIFSSQLLQQGGQALFLIDRSLTQVATITQEQPNLFQFGLNSPLDRLRTMEMRWDQGAPVSQIRVLELGDRIVLFSKDGSGHKALASVDVGLGVPLLIVGDYLGDGTRQLVFVP